MVGTPLASSSQQTQPIFLRSGGAEAPSLIHTTTFDNPQEAEGLSELPYLDN